MAKKILILGAGNLIRGDDAVGIEAVRKFQKGLDSRKRSCVEIKELEDAHINILDVLEFYDKLVIVDALTTDKEEQGNIRRIDYGDLKANKLAYSSHQMGLSRILEMAEKLKLKVPKEIIIFAVAIKSADYFTSSMSPEIKDAVSRIVNLLNKEIEQN